MRVILLVSALLIGSSADNPKDEVQLMNLNVKSVKGGGYYKGGENLNRFYNNTQHGYGQINHTAAVNREVGVCYIEVPTATLVRDPKHIPAGNGSRPDLSRIRSCCAGYIRNIHNFHICDPVCTKECINALCTAPETCTCFPDHVKNLAGFCVATCPIGCQNGHCAGGECLCKEGFKLDVNGRFCVPYCRANCGGVGNCTAPNICVCRPGYYSTPDGSCRPGAGPTGSYPQTGVTVQTGSRLQPGASQIGSYPQPGSVAGSPQQCGSCANGYCVGTECRCRPGYLIYKGDCKALCNPNCGPSLDCVAPNVCGPRSNATQPHNPNSYPNGPQYPHPNQSNNTTYQNPNQYPNGQYPQNQNQYPYPNGQNPNQYPNSQNHNQYPGNHPQNNSYQQYPGQYQPYPIYAPHPGQQNQYPGQPNPYVPQDTYPNQPNGTNYPHHGQYPQHPGQQHIYPELPSNTYPNNPQTYHGTSNGTGQVFYQNPQYNPLENLTFNLQGRPEQGPGQNQNVTQGQQHFGEGHFFQGQYSHGQNNQSQFSQGQYEQGQYGQGQYSQGQYGQGQYEQNQHSQGQYNHGQYGQGQYNQGQYGQGQYSQGQYGHGQQNQGQYGQGQYGQGQYYQGPGSYDQQNTQISDIGAQCDQTCQNGRCVGLNTCQCFTGYNLDPTDTTGTRCVPHCPGGCPNGYCASPNNCLCNEGYQKDFSVKGRSGCIKRVRRSIEETPVVAVSDLLVFKIPDDEEQYRYSE